MPSVEIACHSRVTLQSTVIKSIHASSLWVLLMGRQTMQNSSILVAISLPLLRTFQVDVFAGMTCLHGGNNKFDEFWSIYLLLFRFITSETDTSIVDLTNFSNWDGISAFSHVHFKPYLQAVCNTLLWPYLIKSSFAIQTAYIILADLSPIHNKTQSKS